jgi:hypothetical protein
MSTKYNMAFPFMRLPPELRSEVYSHLYRVKYPSIVPRLVQAKSGEACSGRWALCVAPTPLLQTSRIIKSEAEDGLRRANLHYAPVLVGLSADAPLFNMLLHTFKRSHDQDKEWLQKIGSSPCIPNHELEKEALKHATQDLALQLDRVLMRDRNETCWVKPRHVHSFVKWTLLRLRHFPRIDVLFRVHVSIFRPRSTLSGGNFDIWSSATMLKESERGGLVVAHHIKVLTARHIERAVLEDQLGDWKTRLDELGVTWGVASQDEALERLFPATFSKLQNGREDRNAPDLTSDHKITRQN